MSHLFEKGSIELGGTEDKAVFARIIELLGRQLQTNIAQIYPGSVFGMDDYFIKHSAQMQQLDSNGAGIRKPVVVVRNTSCGALCVWILMIAVY